MDNRKEIYEKLKVKYPDLVWNSIYMSLLKVFAQIIRRFPIDARFEEKLPEDGVLIFAQNHCNIYDSLILDKVMRGYDYFCFAGDEPRYTLSGKSFEAKGVVWVDRSDAKSRNDSKIVLEESRGGRKFLNTNKEEVYLDWGQLIKIGDDIILIDGNKTK